jgi:hypothetical protein
VTGGIEVKGDAGQVVGGDVREGARAIAQGNVLNVNFGQGETVETISWRQKKAIWRRAKRIAALTGGRPVEIYGEWIFPRHEIGKIEHLPAARYWRVINELDERIEKLSRPPQPAPAPAPQSCAQKPVPIPARPGGRRWGRYVLLLVIAGVGWRYLPTDTLDRVRAKVSALATPAAPVEPSPSGQADACLYDGKVHSIGSIVVMAGIRSVCQAGEHGADAVWKAMKPVRRRPAPPKAPEEVLTD